MHRPRSWGLPCPLILTLFRMVTATAIECNRPSEAGVYPISMKQSFKKKPTGRLFHFCNTRRNYPKKEKKIRNNAVKCSLYVYGSSRTLCSISFFQMSSFLLIQISTCLFSQLLKNVSRLFRPLQRYLSKNFGYCRFCSRNC